MNKNITDMTAGSTTRHILTFALPLLIGNLFQQLYGSLGMAFTTYTGQNIGAAKNERVKAGFRTSTLTALLFSIALIPLCFLTGKLIIGAFVKDSGVIALGVEGLRIDCIFYFALGMIYVARSILNGCGDAGFALFNGMTEVVCRILYSQLFIRIPAPGYRGIWITTGATWTTTAVVCVIRYCSGKWRKAAHY